mmetsp:Transcript_34043/g.50535  ORF Transcript_34043/g.50535 Transcript_34043/m.50535 type:complete len:228 (-) Transcript_34043:1446-2129(-)
MCNIIVRHGKNGQLGNGTVTSNHTSSTFVNCGQICVHVTRVSTTSRNFFTGSRDLTQGISIRGHIRKNNQHMQVTLVGQILSGGKRQTGRNNTLNGRIIGQVQEQGSTLHSTTFLEVSTEETGGLHVDTHSSKDNSEVLLVTIDSVLLLHQRGLTRNLSGDLVMRKTGSREDRNLLSTGNGVHHIDSRDTGLDHGFRVITRRGVNGLSIDIKVGLSKDLGGRINDLS